MKRSSTFSRAAYRHCFNVGLGILLCSSAVTYAAAQKVQVKSRVKVSPAAGGWYPWYALAADPSDPKNLIACGFRGDVRDNAFYGFVYSTTDGGKTWRTVLEDKNSTWVSEQSCAFGAQGKAYFVSAAARVADGVRDLGTTRIFVSNDAGRSWVQAKKTGWADYSASLVDAQPGAGQNTLYMFFHDLDLLCSLCDARSLSQIKPHTATNGTRVSVLRFREGDRAGEAPLINERMQALGYRGSFPRKALLLKDGALLAFYFAGIKTRTGSDIVVAAERLSGAHSAVGDPITIVRSAAAPTVPCLRPSHFDAAYDSANNRLYLVYPVFSENQCRLMLKTSVDDGGSWSSGREIPYAKTLKHGYFAPAIAVNGAGVLGLIWQDQLTSDCWYFSASSDGGTSFTPERALSRCPDSRPRHLTETDLSLRFDSSNPQSAPSAIRLHFLDSRGHVWRNAGALVATSDGVFHALWIEAGHGEGELRTAAVSVGAAVREPPSSSLGQERDLRDVSQDIAVLYGGDQHYDRSSNTLSVDVVLKNKSNVPITAPLLVKVTGFSSGLRGVEIANSSNGVAKHGALWDVTRALPNGVLQPGRSTRPYSLIFRVPGDAAPQQEVDLLSMQVRILTGSPR